MDNERFPLSEAAGAANVCVKLSDFSRARSVADDEYMGDRSEKIFVKWAAPEVLKEMRYSTKSDVWSLAIVFWEVNLFAGSVCFKLPSIRCN
jgi:serine/threonine protein kinase